MTECCMNETRVIDLTYLRPERESLGPLVALYGEEGKNKPPLGAGYLSRKGFPLALVTRAPGGNQS